MPDLSATVERVARYLPAQGPIGVFVHHNTLHAFEDEPFEDAVVRAATRFGCEPFLAESVYRDELRKGRIGEGDILAVLDAALGDRGADPSVVGGSRRELWRLALVHGITEARGVRLSWLLDETRALAGAEALFRACVGAAERSDFVPNVASERRLRHRDLVLEAYDLDPDAWTQPLQVRFLGAYLDQGLSHWAMPGRERGIYECFVDLYGRPLARLAGTWASVLVRLIGEDRAAGRTAEASLSRSLADLGIGSEEAEDFLLDEALVLRGWSGMVSQLETRPDRVPSFPLPARLVDHLAVHLLLTRAGLIEACRLAGADVPLCDLRATLSAKRPAPIAPLVLERAFSMFQAAKLGEVPPARIAALTAADVARLEADLAEIEPRMRRKLLHLAYERRLRHRFYDALATHEPRQGPAAPELQAIFCLDEREESMRRHLEEVAPDVETFSTAGFFGVAMYHHAAHAAHARALCPVSITPERYVAETSTRRSSALSARLRRARRRFWGRVDETIHVGSRTFGRGALIATLVGAFFVLPLVFRVLFPWSRRGVARIERALGERAPSRLALDREGGTPPLGSRIGFDVDEMAHIVRGQLVPLGILGRIAPLVLVFGHGSSSLNNPQESAHDCGACGGGRGGPNARAFAQMANDPRVRARLAELGVHIPEATWFVGGQRNTASNDIELYDEDRVPPSHRDRLERARATIDVARRREAHERCRRFDAAPPFWMPEAASLMHVQARAADLAQPRPEYGHASNAFCVVGRRSRTRGIFLDRRAFLVSYDPERDPEGVDLAPLLRAVVPVVAGISLEYFFGYVDPTGYGCGTKLPHNVAGLLGVMDGAASDLRTGLPWQMLEIHEPVRLTIVVEAKPDVLSRIVAGDEDLARQVRGGWIFLAALDPASGSLFEIDIEGSRAYFPEEPLRIVPGSSRAHYAGRSEHLPFVRIEPRRSGRPRPGGHRSFAQDSEAG